MAVFCRKVVLGECASEKKSTDLPGTEANSEENLL